MAQAEMPDALVAVMDAVTPAWAEDDELVSVPTGDLAVYLAEARRMLNRWPKASRPWWARVANVLEREMHTRVKLAWRTLERARKADGDEEEGH